MPFDSEVIPKVLVEDQSLPSIKNTSVVEPPVQLAPSPEAWETFKEILQKIYDVVTSPEFAAILQIIKKIIELIIGSGSLVALMGYDGFQQDMVNKYVNVCSFLVTLTKNDMGLFDDKMHALILFLNVLSNKDLLAFAVDWKTVIWQIIIWIIEKLLGGGIAPVETAEANSYVFAFVRYFSLVVFLHYLQRMLTHV